MWSLQANAQRTLLAAGCEEGLVCSFKVWILYRIIEWEGERCKCSATGLGYAVSRKLKCSEVDSWV